ncbi:MAG: rhodanese-like domain-containing protein [Gammaproteobacteria bacterium]
MYDTFQPSSPVGLMDFVKAARSRVSELSAADLQRLMDEREDLMVLDVRESSEHEQGHLPKAMLVPRGILEAAADPGYPKHVPELVAARGRPVVTYCATGGRSAMAAAVLEMMGFGEVYSLAGGISEWEKAGLPLATEARYV